MNRAQKMAWFLVVTISLAVASSLVAFAVFYVKFGILLKAAIASSAFLAIAGFGGLGPIVFPKDKGKIVCDERDIFINRQAAIAGFATAFLVVGLACMLPFFILGPQATVAVWWLPNIFGAAGLATFFVHSVVILVLYRGKEKNNE